MAESHASGQNSQDSRSAVLDTCNREMVARATVAQRQSLPVCTNIKAPWPNGCGVGLQSHRVQARVRQGQCRLGASAADQNRTRGLLGQCARALWRPSP